MDQNGLSAMRGSNQIIIYTDCNRIKGSFDKCRLKICFQALETQTL